MGGQELPGACTRFFLDTNILVYSFDGTAQRKRDRAQELITAALEGAGMISSQVVQEFLNVALRKFMRPTQVSVMDLYHFCEMVKVHH